MNQAFIDACNFVMPYGKFKGQRLAQIGLSDPGLRYLDWLARQGWFDSARHAELRLAVLAYLEHPALGAQVEAAIEY